MLSVEDAVAWIVAAVAPLGAERLPLSEAAGRVLTKSVCAPIDLPTFDNSAMDGYAVRAEDIISASMEKPVRLKIVGESAAGSNKVASLTDGTAVRIFTGSSLPNGADAVVMQEDTRRDGEFVAVLDQMKPWENIRLRGEDVKVGESLLNAGARLTAAGLGLMAACGIAEVEVAKRPVVGLLSTGNELCEPGVPLPICKSYESNQAALAPLVEAAGGMVHRYPIVTDTLEATRAAMEQAFSECDAVVTSGGVSVGEHDHVKSAFEAFGGKIDFWRVAMRPGKPFVFGRRGEQFLFGLPGNPVSAFVTFLVLVRPALLRMQGASEMGLQQAQGELTERIINKGDRRHFMRMTLRPDGRVESAGPQASHMLGSLARANALLDLPPGATIEAGSPVKVLLW